MAAQAIAPFAAAAEKTEILAAIAKFTDAFNKGDLQGAATACASPAAVIDDFPPHAWSSCAAWATDFASFAAQEGLSKAHVAEGKPSHVDVTADRAYVVMPSTLSYVVKGKKVTEPTATWSFALKKEKGWVITGWAWADH